MIIRSSKLIPPAFHSLWATNKTYQVAKGGRSSGKSSTFAFKLIKEIMKNQVNALVVRRVGSTLRKSCFEQIKEAAYLMGVSHLFKALGSTLEITYKPTGQLIMFRGADDSNKIKSIKTSKFPISILWIEELADFREEIDIDIIIDSVLRASTGFKYQFFFSYNPPKRKSAWVNRKYESVIRNNPDTFIHHSDYRDNPYLSDEFIRRAEKSKEENPNFYKWNYLGYPMGGGLVPFNNLEFCKIDSSKFDNIRQGIDWGFGVDPLAFTRSHFDKTKRDLYVFGEIYRQKMHDVELASRIKVKRWNDTRIIADSENPNRIHNLKNHGIPVIGAKKGPGSVESGLEWLDSLHRIYIDPKLAIHTAEEFEVSEYAVDRFGELIPRLDPKLPDHAIDSIRYATEQDQITTRSLDELYR